MLKKQIIFIFSLYLLFFNILSFPMEAIKKGKNKEEQLIIFNQHQLPLIEQSRQPITGPTIPGISTSQSDSSDIQVNERLFKSWFKEVMGPAFVDSISGLHEICHRIRIFPKTDSIRILLDGPPGAGKSIIAETFAEIFGKKIRVARASNANTRRGNSLGSQIKSIINGDESKEPYAIFIKKVDQVDDTNLDYGVLISFMDKAENEHCQPDQDSKKVPHVIFLATTHNRHPYIKEAIERRLRHIKVDYPDYSLRATIFRNYFTLRYAIVNTPDYVIDPRGCNRESLIQSLAKETKGFSVKDLKKLFMLAEQFAKNDQRGKDLIVLQETHMLKAYRELALDMYLKQLRSSFADLKDHYKNSFIGAITIGIFHKCCRLKRSISCYNQAWLSPLYSYPASVATCIRNFILNCHQSIFKRSDAEKLE